MIFNKSMKLEYLFENKCATELFDRFLPGMRAVVEGNSQALKLSVEQFVMYSKLPDGEVLLETLDKELKKLNTPENKISPSEAKQIEAFREIARSETDEEGTTHYQDAVYPGQPWLDTKGKRIQAHGGAMYYEDGVYYWYGENKQYTDGKNGVWTWGIKVYSSKDLCNWEDEGYIIPPVLDDPDSPLFPARRIDRPHILKCPKTGKYVCWIKLSGPEAAFTVWQANHLCGPYEMIEDYYNPGGHKVGDFDLIADEKTGKGYLYFDADHKSMLCMELSEDYLHAEKELARNYPDLHPPFTREAPALFEYDGMKYMLTSGMTGYIPNRSDAAVSEDWGKVFKSIGDPHVSDSSCASFNSQISKVFQVEGTEGLFIAMADRWVPGYHVNAEIADLFTRVIAENYDPEHYSASDEERQDMYKANVLENADTSIADYVWLPFRVTDGRVRIAWMDRWNLTEFGKE